MNPVCSLTFTSPLFGGPRRGRESSTSFGGGQDLALQCRATDMSFSRIKASVTQLRLHPTLRTAPCLRQGYAPLVLRTSAPLPGCFRLSTDDPMCRACSMGAELAGYALFGGPHRGRLRTALGANPHDITSPSWTTLTVTKPEASTRPPRTTRPLFKPHDSGASK